ncbi:mediator of DNA damage checkpoint protein 1 [Carcharodon carcharias]|uniref:mediator of DNA damage checkpoint protein 1 n=1 Tax=Carcharodon carcharias TaxID=13397 RepID=UPI001B7E42A4|nr:mediator of DNA damage checkpoint protein 1 [Carcharodon carcharias]
MDQTQMLSWEPEEKQQGEDELRDSDREPRGRLRVFAGSLERETDFLVYTGENVIGRHESCHIHIPVQSVSKKHAVIEIEGDSHLIHDCNSLNKTRRKNAKLKPNVRYAINDGDLFLFADVACQYRLLPPAPAKDDDSGSETGSESMFPQSRLGTGAERPDSGVVASDDLISKATSGDLESLEDSLVLLPTQPYQTKSSMPFQSDTYVKESEDDDTPWKGTGSFASRHGRHPNTSIHQTPSAHVVPESDDEGDETSRSNAQSVQLHYDSDTDLEEDQQPGEKWAELSPERPVDDNHVNSKTGAAEEHQDCNSLLATGVTAANHSNTTQETISPGKALDCDAGKISSQEPGVPSPAAVDLLPHFSRDGNSEVELEEQDSGLNSGGLTVCTETDSGLTKGAEVQEAVTEARARSLIHPGKEKESSKADDGADSNAALEGEARETAGNINETELLEVNSDTDIDDDTDSYALQPTQCFILAVSDTQDETAGEDNYTPDGNTAAASNTEEEVTQPFSFQSPIFGKDTFKSNTAAASNTEEEATQPFIFQSPTLDKVAFKSNAEAASNTEEEATQLFTFQSPTFDKGTSKNTMTASNTEEDATQPITFQSPTSSKGTSKDNTVAVSNTEEEATQPINQSPMFGKESFKKPFTSGFGHGSQLGNSKGNSAAASNTEEEATQPFTAAAATLCPVAAARELGDGSEPSVDEPAVSNPEDGWANEETQPFCLRSPAAEVECAEESGDAEGTVPTSPSEDCPAPTLQDQPDSPPKTSWSLLEAAPKEEISIDPLAATDQLATPEAREGGGGWQTNEEVNSLSPAEQQPAKASEEVVNGEASRETTRSLVQESGDSPSVGRGEVAGPDTEERSSQNLASDSAPNVMSSRRSTRRPSVTETEDSAIPRDQSQQRKSSSARLSDAGRRQRRKAPEPSAKAAAATPVDGSQAGPRRGRGRPKSVSVSTTDDDRGPPGEESPQAATVRGRRAKQRSVAAPEIQAESVEDSPQTDGPSQQRPTGRGRKRSVAAPESQAENVEQAPQTDGPSQQRPAGRGRGRKRSLAAPESQAESVEQAPQTDGPSQQHPTGRGRGRKRSLAAPESQAESVEQAPQTDGPSQQHPAGRGRGRKRSLAAPESQAESVEQAPQTDGPSQQHPAGRGRGRKRSLAAPESQAESVEQAPQTDGSSQQPPVGRGRRRPVAAPESQAESDEQAPQTDDSSQQRPAGRGRGRRRPVAAPVSQAESVEDSPQTDGSPQQSPAGRGRGRRKQERAQSPSQETGLASGCKRRTRVTSPSESEKETSTPPQVKTRRTACRLPPHSSSRSLPDSVAPPKIMFTGLVDENGVKVIKQLGGEVVESVHDSTHLVTDRIRRTVKFLCAVARGIPVVTPEWLNKCGKSSCFLSSSGFLVKDNDQEQKFNFRLADSLQKAKKQPLLQDYRVHVTPGVLPEPSQMESIVKCSGATILPKMPRTYKGKTLVISCPDDLPKCKAARDAGVPIVNAEFVLTGILQQTVDLVSYRLDGNADARPEEKGKKRSSTAAAKQPAGGKRKKR